MKTTILKVDATDATVQYTPNWLQRMFGVKRYIEQFYLSDDVFRLSNECVWYSYQTGAVVGLRSNLHQMLHNARRVYLHKGNAPL